MIQAVLILDVLDARQAGQAYGGSVSYESPCMSRVRDRRHPSARLKTWGPTTFLDVGINFPCPTDSIFQPHRFREQGSPLAPRRLAQACSQM